MQLVLPPLPEQRRIAAILDTLDTAIRTTERLIAKLELVKQGLLHDLLTRGIDANGELRDPERHPDQFKDSALGPISEEWEVATLDLLANNLDGQRVPLKKEERASRRGADPYYGGVWDYRLGQ
jgi:type I restriction enzyme S subunit